MVVRNPDLASRSSGGARRLAALGAAVALVGWLAAGSLGLLAKFGDLALPLAPVAAVVGAALVVTRARWLVWIATGIAVVMFAVVAFTPLSGRWLDTDALVRRDSLPAAPARLDAVVVLSEGITRDSLLSPGALDRLLSALALMRDSVADTLVVSRPRRRDNGATTAPDQAWVRSLVARPFVVLAVDSVHNTHDEAVRAAALLRPRGATRVAVVTEPLHSRRACATFEAAGFAVTCLPARERAYTLHEPASARDRLAIWNSWLYERAAWVEYRARGWVRPSR